MSISLILPSALLLVPYMSVEVHWPMMTTLCCRWSVLRKTGRYGVGKTRCLLWAQADKCKPLINGRCTNYHLSVLREVRYDTIRHGMRVEHGLKSWLWPLSLIKQTKQKTKKICNKQTNASAQFCPGQWCVKEMSLSLEKKTEKTRNGGWWERRRGLWRGDARRMRWTRRTVNKMRLTGRRRELIPQVRWCKR